MRTPEGLYCPAGDFHIDPLRPVKTAIISHAHSDHARAGHGHYHASESCIPLLKTRLNIEHYSEHGWGRPFKLGKATVSFHPAGHVLGSAQIRVTVNGEVWVFSGDYKRMPDASCEPFELVECDTFITEATFGLPVYRWEDPQTVFQQMADWLQENRKQGQHSLVLAYSLGKAQRVLANLQGKWDDIAWVHGSIHNINQDYMEQGIELLPTRHTQEWDKKEPPPPGQLIIAPPGAVAGTWVKRFTPCKMAGVSGWAAIRGIRRRQGYNRGFAVSDHADWPNLIRTIKETKAQKVWVTHGQSQLFARYIREELGIEADAWDSLYGGDEAEEQAT